MKLAIIGAGGHGRVVLETLLSMEGMAANMQEACFIDPDPAKAGQSIRGLPVVATAANLKPNLFIVAVGDNRRRQHCFDEMRALGWQPINAIHPSAVVSSQVSIGRGVLIGARAVINCDSTIGDNVIVNTAAVVEHDCHVGAHSHVAPRTVLGGGASTGEGVLVGIGSTICPGAKMGDWSILGAGSVLLDTLEARATAYGVPARLKQHA